MKSSKDSGSAAASQSRAWIACSLFVSAAVTLAAANQRAWAADPGADAKAPALKEVVVTAERRAQNIQRVPISISAFTAHTLRQRGITHLAQIANYTPNLEFTAGASGMPGSANFFIRGIGQDDFITTTEPGVGIYVDGVYLSRVTGADIAMADIQRVEVLRGPQGTLFGRNTIGGAVNIVTQQPTDRFSGRASVTGGNQQTFGGSFTLNGAVIPGTLAARGTFYTHSTSGWGKDIWPGASRKSLGQDFTDAASGELLFTPTSRLSILGSFDYTQSRGTTVPIGLVAFTPSPSSIAYNQTAAIPIGPQYITHDPNHIQTDTPVDTHIDVRGVSLTATWKGDEVSFKSISAYRAQNGLTAGDYDGTPAPYLEQVVPFGQSQFSQEFQAYGNAIHGDLKWLTGLYYFQESGRFDSAITLTGLPIEIYTNNRTHSYAAYGQLTYSVTHKLSLTAGIRGTRDAKNIRAMTNFAGFTLLPETARSASWSNVSPMGSVRYQFTRSVMMYASVTRGFRSGGYNGRPFSPADLTSFLPETVTAYETGVKSQWLENRLQLDVDGFYEDYRNMQETATTKDAQGNFIVVTGNAARALIHGAELELQAVPLAGLHLYGSLGLTYDTVKENPNFYFGAKELPNASKVSYTIGGDYTVPAGNWGELTMGADYDYRSGYYPQFNETQASHINGFGLLNARLQLAVGNWSLKFYGRNLTNKIYWNYAETAGSGDTTVAFFGPTRQWGATMSYRF